MNKKNSLISTFVVKDDKFIIDTDDFNENLKNHPNAEVIDAKNKLITPGLIDSHGHSLFLGEQLLKCNLKGSKSVFEIRSKLLVHLQQEKLNKNQWIYGIGWDQTLWSTEFPTFHDLESELLSQFPIILTRIDYHCYWLNRKAIEFVKPYLPTDLKVEGGEILLVNGNISGIFLDNAMSFVDLAKPLITEAEILKAFKLANDELLRYGVTSMHDAGLRPSEINILKKAVDLKYFKVKNYVMINCFDMLKLCDEEVDKDVLYFTNNNNIYKNLISVRSVKLFLDGALGSWGAKLLAPYSGKYKLSITDKMIQLMFLKDDTSKNGFLRIPEKELPDIVRKWSLKGYQVNIHAIGDEANKIALDAMEQSYMSDNFKNDKRFRIEHAQILRLTDIGRFKNMSIIASMQPTHATSDMKYAEKRLGPQRILGAYAWKTLINAGVTLALSSDFPVEPVNPLQGIYSAVTRKDKFGDSPHGKNGWYPNEKLSITESLKGFTINGAFSSFQENLVGSIENGKFADFVIFDKDFINYEGELDILKSKVLSTVVNGELVFGSFP
ncbi:hypothetical protein HDU92_000068 [Lobulomyces angularis]|nr:hypothetical protein HDU92_000068 [Lobulomyces angularis]